MSDIENKIDLAKEMGEDFAKHAVKGSLKRFLVGSGILDDEYHIYEGTCKAKPESHMIDKNKFLDHLIKDYEHAFGQEIAIAYCIGHIDSHDQLKRHTYKQKLEGKDVSEESPAQLTLPGSKD